MKTAEMIDKIKKHPLCRKNLYKATWISGSQTVVYPIMIRHLPLQTMEITLQWNSNRECPAFMNWIKENFENVKSVLYWKSDGSCPNTITIYCTE